MNITISILSAALIILGIYLLTYKRPLLTGQACYPEPAWLSTLSASAQAVHRKEWKKQTSKKFTLAWVKEYLSGQRSAFYAYLTWGLVLPGVFCLTIGLMAVLIFPDVTMITTPENYPVLGIAESIYKIFASYILLVCAANSTVFFRYVANVIAYGAILLNVLHIFNLIL